MTELELLNEYLKHDDQEALGQFIEGRMDYIRRVIYKCPLPQWVDRDQAFADALGEVFIAMKHYDSEKSAVSTYLYMVASKSAIKSQNRQSDSRVDEVLFDHAVVVNEDAGDCLSSVEQVVRSIPRDEINEESHKILTLLVDGYDDSDIASIVGLTGMEADRRISHLRNYLAWMLVTAGVSIEPVVTDDKLSEMAEQYERDTSSWLS